MCLERRAWRRVGRIFLQVLLAILFVGTLNFATATGTAQTQDYINGAMSEQTKALSDRVGNLEKVLYFVLAAVGGVLITNIMGLRNQGRDRQQTIDERDSTRRREDSDGRVIERRLKPRGRDE